MAHEMVFNADGTARMIYVTQNGVGVPWHTYGKGFEGSFTLDDAHAALGTDSLVTVEDLYLANGKLFHGAKASVWEGSELGSVGPTYKPLQNKDFVNSFKPWLDSKLGTLETMGLLRGGAVIWGQVRLAIDPVEIRPGDVCRTFGTFVHSHDGTIGLTSGTVMTRQVCMNTVKMSLSEGGFNRKKHTGDVVLKAADLQMFLIKAQAEQSKNAEALKFLAQTAVKSDEQIWDFVQAVNGKTGARDADWKPGKVETDIQERFARGIGNGGSTYWDLLNAWSERLAHGQGNSLTGESDADRVARRLDSEWFGTGSLSNARALNVAMAHAKLAA